MRGIFIVLTCFLPCDMARRPASFGAFFKTCTSNDMNSVRYFDSHTDTGVWRGPYPALNFTPQFGQYMDGFKMFYLQSE